MHPPSSADTARRALDAADDGENRMRAAVTYGRVAPYLVLWGFVWAAGFTGMYLAPDWTGTLWQALTGIGWAVTAALVLRQRRAGRARGLGQVARYALTAGLLSAYAWLWAFILLSGHPNAASIYAGTVTGFSYLAAGLWRGPLLAGLGAAVTLLFLAGLLISPAAFPLYAGLLGGGGLAAAGLLLAQRDPT